jgi:hypothetical protein
LLDISSFRAFKWYRSPGISGVGVVCVGRGGGYNWVFTKLVTYNIWIMLTKVIYFTVKMICS